MKSIYQTLFLVGAFLLALPVISSAQALLCNQNGNLVMFANYDGGVLTINCDVNIPNLKIGVCTYEPVTINITGPFAGNVTEVRYAGYVSTNNFHCSNSPATTTITGVPANITSVNFLPPSTLSNPNGSNSIVCAYSCPTNSNQGGCNTSDQVVDYFQTTMNAAMRSYYTQYGCWSTSAYAVSGGGNCCPNVPPPGCNITANAGQDTTICSGNSTQLNGSTTGGSTYTWSPATGLSCTNCPNPIASPTVTTTYVLTVTDGGPCTEFDTVVVSVNSPQVTTSPFNPVCPSDPPFALSGGMPANGTWSGTGVNNGIFDPSIGPGFWALTYTYVDGLGCSASATQSIVVNYPPQVNAGTNLSVCQDGIPFPMTGASPNGGSYSGPGILNGIFNPAVAGVGTHNYVYTYTDSNGCTASDTAQIEVNATPAPPVISQTGPDMLMASQPGDSFHWFLNFNLLPSTGQTLQTTTNGTYTVTVWVNGCESAPSNLYPFEFVAIDEALAPHWAIYPNPANDMVTVAGSVLDFQTKVHDLTGRVVFSQSTLSGLMQLDLRGLAAGQYILEVRSELGLQYRRVTVQR